MCFISLIQIKQYENFQIVGIPSSKNILQVRQTELLKPLLNHTSTHK